MVAFQEVSRETPSEDWSHAQWPIWIVQWRRQPHQHALSTLTTDAIAFLTHSRCCAKRIRRPHVHKRLQCVRLHFTRGNVGGPLGGIGWTEVRTACGRTILVIHANQQGREREQGDALVPLLHSLGQHQALDEVVRGLVPIEKPLIWMMCTWSQRQTGTIVKGQRFPSIVKE